SQEMYALYRNLGDGYFQYATNKTGIGHATLPYSGWSTKFIDYDNDGWKDIFVAQGHVLDTIGLTAPNLKYLQPPLLLHNVRGSFTLWLRRTPAPRLAWRKRVEARRSETWITTALSTW